MARRASAPISGKKNVLGSVIREFREKHDLKQMEVCARLQSRGWDVAPTLYSQIEGGKRSLTDIEIDLILRCFGETWVSLAELASKSERQKKR